MSNQVRFSVFPALATLSLLSGCATSSSDLRPNEIAKDHRVIVGHLDVYNGDEKIDFSSSFKKCYATFTDEKSDKQAFVRVDDNGWIFTSLPIGNAYLSDVRCLPGYLKSHIELETRELKFKVSEEPRSTYFGHVTLRFNYHGINVLGMFGLVGAATQIATESGDSKAAQVSIEDQLNDASATLSKRYELDSTSSAMFDSTISVKSTPTVTKSSL